MKHERNRFDKLLQIRAPQTLSDAIDVAADRQFQSKSEYIRHSVLDRLKADGVDPAQRTPFDLQRPPSFAPDVTDALVGDRGVNDGVRDRAMAHECL